MKVAIIKYNAGNVRSVTYAMERIGIAPVISDDPAVIGSADKVIFPGVGEAGSAMKFLKERNLDQLILSLKQPVLGICLGMQLMCAHSEESDTPCLAIFRQKVKRFDKKNKVPQIGWNNITDFKSPLFTSLSEREYMYFVHGYYAELGENTIASATYGLKYSAALQKNNFFAVQFHPEKSSEAGQKILENFIAL
ncbi:MAG TPA: imidazole glycerol phosphate synthase subunit HisH [Bacteroidia bacterium]|jgi:glutamine amidotransferase